MQLQTSIRSKEMKQLTTLGSTESHDGNENSITIKGHW